MSLLRTERGIALTAIIVVLALFLVRPGAQQLRARIAHSLSLAVGRQVEVAEVRIRLLPQPGFDLQEVVIHDDAAFSAEPMLRASEVTAYLRLSSLVRGRLEIARLDLTEPSLNLVRNDQGHWNLENLLERVAKTPVAPTAKATTEKRPAFPYIEADRGRINFKFGQEKKPYAFTDADFALWQDSENAWGMRLKAQPVRTDFNLSDTGTLRVNGTWQRATSLRQTPLQFNLQWDGGQLGQATTLVSGRDRGWRGTLKISASLSGEPADLAMTSHVIIQDFRRYDIVGGGPLKLAAQCTSRYSSAERRLSQVVCLAPVGDGAVTLQGSVAGLGGAPSYDLVLFAQDVPVQSMVVLARHAKKDIPDDLIASGKLDGRLQMRQEPDRTPVWDGGGETAGLRLTSRSTDTQLALDRVPFEWLAPNKTAGTSKSRVSSGGDTPVETRVVIGPFELALGRGAPAVVSGWLSRSGYSMTVNGDAQVPCVLQVARTLGLAAAQLPADGFAHLDLHIAGRWSGFAAPQVVGKAQLRAVRAELRGVNAPLEIAAADLALQPEQIDVTKISASLGASQWRGALAFPRHCVVRENCPIHFDLHTDQLSSDEVYRLLGRRSDQRPWYRFLSFSSRKPPLLASMQAEGTLTADRLIIRKLIGTHAAARLELGGGKLRVSNLRTEVLGGQHTGEWKLDFTGKAPEYSGSGSLQHIDLARLAQLMHDGWITGTANASYHMTASGLTAEDLLGSANATVQVEARAGTMPHLSLTTSAGPLRMRHLHAQVLLQDGQFRVQEGKLETPTGIYQVSGTASLGKKLDFKLLREGAGGFAITGTLGEPRVAAAPETHAELKP